MPKAKKSAILTPTLDVQAVTQPEPVVPASPSLANFLQQPAPNAIVQGLQDTIRITEAQNFNATTHKAQSAYEMRDKVGAVDIYQANGRYIRTFSREVHGDKYEELAKQLCHKMNQQLIIQTVL